MRLDDNLDVLAQRDEKAQEPLDGDRSASFVSNKSQFWSKKTIIPQISLQLLDKHTSSLGV